jgi:hypothetical protein
MLIPISVGRSASAIVVVDGRHREGSRDGMRLAAVDDDLRGRPGDDARSDVNNGIAVVAGAILTVDMRQTAASSSTRRPPPPLPPRIVVLIV